MQLDDIATKLGGRLIGVTSKVTGLSLLEDIKPDTLVYVQDKRYLAEVEESNAGAILVPETIESAKKPIIQVKHPKAAFFALFELFYPKKEVIATVSAKAIIADDVALADDVSIAANVVIGHGSKIGKRVILHAGVVLGENVTLADGVVLHPNVCIYDNCEVGQNSVIHANTVIGSDGFGYVFDGSAHQKIPHVGRVVIGKNVEIGSNTSIDRATMGETVIGDGSKIDNLVQIAHNVKLGKNNIVCASTGIAGSSTCGDNVILAANVGIADHVRIEDNVTLGPRSGVATGKTIRAGQTMLGAPAREVEKAMEIVMTTQRLPQIRKIVQELQKRVKRLEQE